MKKQKIKYLPNLVYPAAYVKVAKPTKSKFDKKLTLHNSLNELAKELGLFEASDIIITMNVPLTRGGMPFPLGNVMAHQPEQVGVSVFFTKLNQRAGLCNDKWDMVQHNVRALKKTIEAFRGIERWGSQESLLNIMANGLPDARPVDLALPSMHNKQWWEILELGQSRSEKAILSAFKRLSQIYHPDKSGGSQEMFKILVDARDKGLGSIKAQST
ncbi:MAG: DnaJ domain-containing protein [Bacteroidota bacterium]